MKSHKKTNSHNDINDVQAAQAAHADAASDRQGAPASATAGQDAPKTSAGVQLEEVKPVKLEEFKPSGLEEVKPAKLEEVPDRGVRPVKLEEAGPVKLEEAKPARLDEVSATDDKPVGLEEAKPVKPEEVADSGVPKDAAQEDAGSEGGSAHVEGTVGEAGEHEAQESSADTVEQILEEHGLTSSAEITEEIAEEIMAVHAAHDEDAKVVVAVDGLYKKYSKKADWAVADVNFHCYEGEIVGLLGHNGAGKSTTIKCLEGMLPFDKGTISICDHDIVKDPISAKANMGFVTDNHAVFVKMTGVQYLAFMADVYNVPTEVRQQRVEELEEVFQLGPAINNLISSYSHGMRQKICMMGSLMHHPKLWVLDEPMTGLDPRTMHAVQVFMRNYADEGNCIIFSSHALITVAKMCDRVVLLRTGCQLDELNIKRIRTVDPTFDFEEYFLKHEGQD